MNSSTHSLFNGHKGDGDGDGDPKGELPEGDNGEGDRENGEGDCIAGKGQRPVLEGEPLGEGEPNLFVSPISVLGTAFTTNTKNNISERRPVKLRDGKLSNKTI